MKTDKTASNRLGLNKSLSKIEHDFDMKSDSDKNQMKYKTAQPENILSTLEHNLALCLKKQSQVGFIIREISEVLKK